MQSPAKKKKLNNGQSQVTKPFTFSTPLSVDEYSDSGMLSMDSKRKANIRKSFESYNESPSNSNIRIDTHTDGKFAGQSADENVPTAFLRTKHSSMRPSERKIAHSTRSLQDNLVWTTGKGTPLTDIYKKESKTKAEFPLAAHTPAFKKSKVGGTKDAITTEHGHRNTQRVKNINTTLKDSSRQDQDISLMAKLSTIQLLSSPAEELELKRSKVSGHKKSMFHIAEGQDIRNKSAFDNMVTQVHNNREMEKLAVANSLLHSGYDALVPTEHQTLLTSSKGNIPKAYQDLKSNQHNLSFNTSTRSQTTRLDTASIGQMQVQNKTSTTLNRPLSPPRRIRDK